MSYVIVGSVAANHHRVIKHRQPKDYDIFATKSGYLQFLKDHNLTEGKVEDTRKGIVCFTEESVIVEVELAEKCSNIADILERMEETAVNHVASPDWLYFLKMSHRYAKDSPHFWKTRLDIEYMRMKGIDLPKGSEELLKEREKLTYVNKLPKLNTTKEDFFKKEDSFYLYDHDTIHETVKLFDKPAYQYYMVEGAQVMTSKEKFFEQPYIIRLAGVYEESCVLALERSLIPFDFKPNPEQAFKMALEKVCTSITGGYFREFAYDNIFKVYDLYKRQGKTTYVKAFKTGLKAGVVKPFKR